MKGEQYTAAKIYNEQGDYLLTMFTDLIKKHKFLHKRYEK